MFNEKHPFGHKIVTAVYSLPRFRIEINLAEQISGSREEAFRSVTISCVLENYKCTINSNLTGSDFVVFVVGDEHDQLLCVQRLM